MDSTMTVNIPAVKYVQGVIWLAMYRRYLDMNEDDVANAFGSSRIDKKLIEKVRR